MTRLCFEKTSPQKFIPGGWVGGCVVLRVKCLYGRKCEGRWRGLLSLCVLYITLGGYVRTTGSVARKCPHDPLFFARSGAVVVSCSSGMFQPTSPALYRTPALLGIIPILGASLSYRVPVVPRDFTGTIQDIGTIQPALWSDPHCLRQICRLTV